MSTPFEDIWFDLYQITPCDLQDHPKPYNEYDVFKDKFLQTQRAYERAKRLDGRISQLINAYLIGMLLEKEAETPLQRSYYARQLPQHLYVVSTRLYYIFEFLGPSQQTDTKVLAN